MLPSFGAADAAQARHDADHVCCWGTLPRELLLRIFTHFQCPLEANDRRACAAVCGWWRAVACEGPGLLGELNLNRVKVFSRRARVSLPDYYQQRMGFITWLLPRAAQLQDLTLTADRGLDDSSEAIQLRLAVAEVAGRHLRHLKAISTDNGRVTTAFLAAATRLEALELDFWGHSNAVPRGITAAARLTSLKLQCSSGLGRTSALGALSALRELVVIDGDWQALPPEVVRLPLTRLHLRFADLEAPDWLAALTGGGTQATTAGSNGRASSDGGGTGAAAPEATITVNGAPAPAATITATLEELTLEGCQLRAIPEGLAELTALTSLTLDRNYLTQGSLPDAMSRLCRLRRLSLEACPSLVALPPGLAGLKLEYLNLLQTGVQALPEGAACLAHLTQLSWGMAAAEPVRLGLSALLCAGRLRVLRLDNVSREQDADLPALRQRLAALDYLRINSALLLG